VDLAYCILDDDSNLDDIVGIPPMVPEGCERDWLSRSVRGRSPGDAIIMAVGMGCDDDSQCQDPNIKRLTGEQFVDQLEISESDGEGGPFYSAKRLPVTRFGGDQGLNTGDSGGPALARLPDGTWRVIGVYHGTNSTLDENFPS
jgi:hypothetical protein